MAEITSTTLPESKRTLHQVREYRAETTDKNGRRRLIKAEVRHDDSCKNGHNSFAVTGKVLGYSGAEHGGKWGIESFGCIHDEVIEFLPELEPFIKWHLCSTDGPMHYLENVTYHAGDRDCWGTRKGEVRRMETRIMFGDNPILHSPGGNWTSSKFIAWLAEEGPRCSYDFEIIALHHDPEPDGRRIYGPKFTFGGYPDATEWHKCPFDNEGVAERFLAALQNCEPHFVDVPVTWGEGKNPELEAARNSAIWPDATLEQLQCEGTLRARLPGLMVEFKAAVESLGLVY